MSGIGIITNPHSKLNKRHPGRQRLLGYIVGEHGKLELTNSLEDLARVAESFRDRKIDVLAINGGDGTISRTLTAFIKAYGDLSLPKVLILKGGTINVLAENLGLHGTPEAILVRYIESLSGVHQATSRHYRTLTAEGHYGFLFGNGAVANYLEEFYRNKTGPIGSIFLILKIYFWSLFHPERFKAIIGERTYHFRFDGGRLDLGLRSTSAVMASTVEKMPLGPKLFPDARRQCDLFSFFSLEIPALKLPFRLPLALSFNRPGQRFGRINRLVSSLEITTQDLKPQKYTLDGELFESHGGKLEVSLGPPVEFIIV